MFVRLMFILLIYLVFPTMADAIPQVGESVPEVQFVDIDGKKGATASASEDLSIIFIVGLDSVDRLEQELAGMDIRIMQAHPEASISYLNFADLRSVPWLLQDVAAQIMQVMNNKLKDDLQDSYRSNNVQNVAENTSVQLIPDWNGAHLDAFGVENGDRFLCWIVHQGKVIAYLPEGTENLSERYFEIINETLQAEGK